jgi:hypothetical protein
MIKKGPERQTKFSTAQISPYIATFSTKIAYLFQEHAIEDISLTAVVAPLGGLCLAKGALVATLGAVVQYMTRVANTG